MVDLPQRLYIAGELRELAKQFIRRSGFLARLPVQERG